MLLGEDFVFEQIINSLLRLAATAALRYVAGVCTHGHEVEVPTKSVESREEYVREEVGRNGICMAVSNAFPSASRTAY
jgi:hypothetical protein